ncbi:MAG: SusC/RagA family TonB-linked outer membrane protein [Saprospiraceae bacterium]|nr:SusC/RagA family TonB-linked outer membrane protein [Saprospiraceae bacterium]
MRIIFTLLVLGSTLLPHSALAQTFSLQGTVYDENSDPLIGATVRGPNQAAITDTNGAFVLEGVNVNDVLTISFIGYEDVSYTVNAGDNNIQLTLGVLATNLEDVVVIGYGTVEKSDATGAVESITSKDFNKGPIVSATSLIQGKSAGVSVAAPSGQPGSGSIVRVRGLSSISNTSDPLYIVDGVPLDRQNGPAGSRNPLNFINPQDIESINILKDASATAIYGSRASAGVIIITTKGGSDRLTVEYSANVQQQRPIENINVLGADDFRNLVTQEGTADQVAFLGNSNTNWQDQIWQNAIGTEHNLSVSGKLLKDIDMPFRASVGYSNLDGILQTGNFERLTGSLNVRPSFLGGALKVNANARFARENNQFANGSAIGEALTADPTQSVFSEDPIYEAYGGYYHPTSPGSSEPLFIGNPVASLNLVDNTGNVNQFVGNIQTNYELPWVKGLSANLNLALETADGENFNYSSPFLSIDNIEGGGGGFSEKTNQTMEYYMLYRPELGESPVTNFDIQGGYSYQNFEFGGGSQNIDVNSGTIIQSIPNSSTINLQAFFGRANIELFDKFLLTGTIRRDGTSRFIEENRWGNFPSVAGAWKLINENFLEDSQVFSDLKLRASWGITGNQEVGGAYPSFALYQTSNDQANYIFDDGTFGILRADPYNNNLKWEETETINLGLDFGLLSDRITGSFELYQRDITDLLNQTNFPAGTITTNRFDANIANMETKGVELNLSGYAIDREDLSLRLGINTTVQDIEVTQLNAVPNQDFVDDNYGNIGFGQNGQGLSVGYTPFSYYTFRQVYDSNGNPIENLFVDLNNDGIINDEDRFINESPFADILFNFNNELIWKNFSLNTVWRASYGNFAMNNINATFGNYNALFGQQDEPKNIVDNVLVTDFTETNNEILRSDYYVQDASFVKLDNITAGYNLSDLFNNDKLNLSINGSVQNVLVLTDYDGIDPEIGIDNVTYLRPRIFLFGVNATY